MAVYTRLNSVELYIRTAVVKSAMGKRTERYFVWNGYRYYLSDFTPVSRAPRSCYRFPEYIDWIEADNYSDPLLIERIDHDAVNIYREERY